MIPGTHTRCRTCQTAIVWARTIARRVMPLDAEPVTTRHPRAILFGLDGRRLEVTGDHEVTGHTSHFATCPQATDHRRAVP